MNTFQKNSIQEQETFIQTNLINTYQLILDFCESEFSFPLKRKLNDIKSGIFSEYKFSEPVIEHVDEQVIEPVDEQVIESVDEQVIEPVDELVIEPVIEYMIEYIV